MVELAGGASKERGRRTGELLIRPHSILAWSCSRLYSDPVGVGCTLKTQDVPILKPPVWINRWNGRFCHCLRVTAWMMDVNDELLRYNWSEIYFIFCILAWVSVEHSHFSHCQMPGGISCGPNATSSVWISNDTKHISGRTANRTNLKDNWSNSFIDGFSIYFYKTIHTEVSTPALGP
jgi:hypothetical protein